MKYRYLLLLICLILTLASCEDCEDCGIPASGPSIRLKFFPRSDIRQFDTLIRNHNTNIRLYNDSIRQTELKEDSARYAGLRNILQRKVDSLTLKRTDYNRNIVTIDSVYALDIQKFYNALKDSTANAFRLPFNMNADSSRFVIFLKERRHQHGDTLIFRHRMIVKPKNETDGTPRGNAIRMVLESLSIYTSTFDSLAVECRGEIIKDRANKRLIRGLNHDCSNYEKTTLNIYY